MKRKNGLLFLLLMAAKFAWSQTKGDAIVGYWLTRGKNTAKIKIYRSAGKYFGKIVWLSEPTENGRPKMDKKNPDAGKRNQQLIGLNLLTDFVFDGDNEWEDGKIYDPESGKTYRCYLSLKDGHTLKLRGYIGVSLLGRTEFWTRTTL